jgi:hypothetical protein
MSEPARVSALARRKTTIVRAARGLQIDGIVHFGALKNPLEKLAIRRMHTGFENLGRCKSDRLTSSR